jgi:hypothetical protein
LCVRIAFIAKCAFLAACDNYVPEETTVREKAIETTKFVADNLPLPTFRSAYIAMLFKLASKEWFTARMSACALVAEGLDRFAIDQTVRFVVFFHCFL